MTYSDKFRDRQYVLLYLVYQKLTFHVQGHHLYGDKLPWSSFTMSPFLATSFLLMF